MMLRDNGPTSSFEEDVKALGIGHLFEDGDKPAPMPAPAAKKDDEDEDEDEDDKPAAPQTDVPARQEQAHEDDDEDEDEDEHEGEHEGEDKEEEDEYTDFDALCDEDEKLDAAVDVLNAFYNQLGEGEGDSIDYDSLVGVVEAFEYMTEATGLLAEARYRRGKRANAQKRLKSKLAGRKAHRGSAEMKKARSERKAGSSGKVVVRDGERIRGRAALGLKAKSQAQRKYKGYALKLSGGGTARPVMMRSDVEESGTPISELVDNLSALKEAVQTNVDYRRQAEELKEGFNSIGETASTWMQAIAEEVRASVAEDEDFDADNDLRVQMGRHLDGIAESAALVIQKLDEGDANLDDAAADLQSLSADLNDAAEAMKAID